MLITFLEPTPYFRIKLKVCVESLGLQDFSWQYEIKKKQNVIMIRIDDFILFLFLFSPPNGTALSCGADNIQVADNETSSR